LDVLEEAMDQDNKGSRSARRCPTHPFHLEEGMTTVISNLFRLGLLEIDPKTHRVQSANQWASQITEFTPSQLEGMDLVSLFAPEEREWILRVLSEDSLPEPFDLTLITAKGNTKTVEFSWTKAKRGSGEEIGYIGIKDISHRKALERSAREARDRIKKIAELGDMGILIYDQDFRIEFANQRAGEILGLTVSQLVGSEITRYLRRENRIQLKGLYSPLHRERSRRVTLEMPLVRSDGSTKTVEMNLALARSPSGELKTYVYIRDLSERIRMENELRKANEFLQKVIRSSVDGIIAADMKGNIIIFNEGAERLLKFRSNEVIGKIHITQLYPPGMAKEIMRRLRSDAYGPPGKLPTTQTTLVAKDGEHIPVHISAAIVYEGDQEIATVGIFTDLRERIKMQQQLEETYKQLLQSEKLASLGKLAAGVAHEINNPLGGILMYANMLLEKIQDEDLAADLQEIVDQTLRCKEIVRGLLEFARKRGEEKSLIQINQVIEKCIALLENQALFHNIQLDRRMDPDLPPILADGGQMQQVFTNLLVNAAEAMNGKGRITIRTWHEGTPQMKVQVEVSDTGCGIPDEHLAKIFDPFFTTKAFGKGTGLGLSTTYGIVRRHGGEIQVRSSVGKGTTFRITLPVSSPSAQEEAQTTQPLSLDPSKMPSGN